MEEGPSWEKSPQFCKPPNNAPRDLNLPYEGALYPAEAYEIQQSAPGAKLVDVRSRAELDWVGRIRNERAVSNGQPIRA